MGKEIENLFEPEGAYTIDAIVVLMNRMKAYFSVNVVVKKEDGDYLYIMAKTANNVFEHYLRKKLYDEIAGTKKPLYNMFNVDGDSSPMARLEVAAIETNGCYIIDNGSYDDTLIKKYGVPAYCDKIDYQRWQSRKK